MNNDNPTEIIKKYLDYIDSGNFYKKPFTFLYGLFAVINVLTPFAILIGAISKDIFKSDSKFIIAFILVWVVLFIVSIIGFLIWWVRKDQVSKITAPNDDFVAVPVVAHFVKTFGEWAGTYFGILGFTFALIGRIFLGNSLYGLRNMLGIDILGTEVIHIFLMPLMGFSFIIITRFLAEIYSSFTIIANNTKHLKNTNLHNSVKLNQEGVIVEQVIAKENHNQDDLFK